MTERPMLMQPENVQATLEDRKTETRRLVNLRKILRVPQLAEIVTNQEALLHVWNVAAYPARDSGWVFWQTSQAGGEKAQERRRETSLAFDHGVRPPHGEVGDRLWFREPWRTVKSLDALKPSEIKIEGNRYRYPTCWYKTPWWSAPNTDPAYEQRFCGRWRSPLSMPRWAARCVVEITGVRVERLHAITAAGVLAEGLWFLVPFGKWIGADSKFYDTAQEAYRTLWDSINAHRGFAWETCDWWVWVYEYKKVEVNV